MRHLLRGTVALSLVALFAPTMARAEEQVEVTAEVVAVSTQGKQLEPPSLSRMRDEFAKSPQGAAFTSFRRISAQRLSLKKGTAAQVPLPNAKPASLRLEDIKQGVARISLDVPELVKTSITLGREGSIYHDVGTHQGGKLFLVLSPGASLQPRRVPPVRHSRPL